MVGEIRIHERQVVVRYQARHGGLAFAQKCVQVEPGHTGSLVGYHRQVMKLLFVKQPAYLAAELLFEQIGLNKRESKDMIDAFFDLISDDLVDGSDVKISGFGNFQIRTKAARPGRNPRTGEAILIQARRVVTFHASHKLKDQIQNV